jgi:FkbM family methyltransferase
MFDKLFWPYKLIVKYLSTDVKGKLREIKFLSNLNSFLRAKLKPPFVITAGDKHKIFLDANDSLHLSVHESWEKLESKVIKKYVKEGDIVLDIGANIGYYSLLLAKLVGKNGKVYAFEPDPDNFYLLKKNIEANGYENIIPVQKAVSDKNEKLKLYLQKENFAGHSLRHNDSLNSIEVDSIRLDDFFKNKSKDINFIKMDIEGAEGRALKGMRKLLGKNKKIKIVSEFCPNMMMGCGVGFEEYFKVLHDFEFFNLDEVRDKLELVNPKIIMAELGNEGYTNLLCIRKGAKN